MATPLLHARATSSLVDAEFARIVDELTRRGFLAGGLSGAALLGLAGCESSGSAGDHSSSSSASTTRQVDSVNGKITVPADPKRIVSLSQSDTAVLYDLGMTPVGIFDYGIDYTSPRYRTKYAAAAKIGKTGVEVEKVAALKPDLILGYDVEYNTTAYKQLVAIAPTVIVTSSSWQATAQAVANAVNRSGAFNALATKYKQRCDSIRTQYAQVFSSTKWDVVEGSFTADTFWVLGGPRSNVVAVLADAGVRFASSTAGVTGKLTYQSVSYENIGSLSDADVIAYWSGYGTDTPNNNGPQLFAQQLWKDLPAVKAGHLVPIADVAISGYGDALAVLDEVEAGLKQLGGQ